MNKIFTLEGAYLIASPKVSHELLRGALVYLYQADAEFVSGIVLNKPFQSDKTLGDYLVYPKHLQGCPVWQGGPVATERLIAFSQYNREVYITDRLANLTEEQLKDCIFVVGQCVWDTATLQAQIQQGDWMTVGSNYIIPNQLPAESRIPYILKSSGVNPARYVHMAEPEVV
jgi:putative AlgH/UPF0301 family transcriptional regulator